MGTKEIDMAAQLPQRYAAASGKALPDGTAERFAGYGVLGVPFGSGFYLAFRHFRASSVGPGYRAVWLRRPDGKWTIYADAPADQSCARYFGKALSAAISSDVTIKWDGPTAAVIQVPRVLEWRVELVGSATTRAVSALALRMPARLWGSNFVLRGMGAVVGPLLRAGKVSFSGVVPNGQTFQAQPLRVWSVRSSTATIDGVAAGQPTPLVRQERLGEFWLPQRGLFVADLSVQFPSTAKTGRATAIDTERRKS